MVGFVIDRWRQKAGVLFCMITTAIAYGLVFAWISIWEFGVLSFFVTFVWGVQDSCFCNFLNCILGFEFDSKIIPFSIFKFVQSLFVFVFLVCESKLET